MIASIVTTEPAGLKDEAPAQLLRGSPPSGWELGSPEDADLILFAESHKNTASCGPFLQNVRRHPVYKANPRRCLVHCGADHPYPALPGFYPSIEARWHQPWWTRSSTYLCPDNPIVVEMERDRTIRPDLLGGFVGACKGKPLREKLITLDDPRLQFEDKTEPFISALRSGDKQRVLDLKRHYVEMILRCKYVLCPRGHGASSIRLFEVMRLGRCPVIIADNWVRPNGPDWDAVSIRVPEDDIANLGDILSADEPRAAERGELARQAWEQHFAPDKLLERLILEGSELLTMANARRHAGTALAMKYRFRPSYARRSLKQLKQHT